MDAAKTARSAPDLPPDAHADVGTGYFGPAHGRHRDVRPPGHQNDRELEGSTQGNQGYLRPAGYSRSGKTSLAGVGAQYDSEVVYHSIQKELADQGVLYTDFETAVKEYPEIVQEYFMTLIPPTAHKFAALHGAVWSGGSFVYVPEGVHVDIPLQSYFRLNAAGAGQFEHTLIVCEKNSSLHFIEGCSAPKYNVTNLHAGAVELFVKEGARLRYSTIETGPAI